MNLKPINKLKAQQKKTLPDSSWNHRSFKPYLLAVILLILIVGVYYTYLYPLVIEWSLPKEKPKPGYPPTPDQRSCEGLGGIWGPHGITQPNSCNLPAHDAGMSCYDSIQCEGECIADVSQQDIDDAGGVLKTNGACSNYLIIGGCKMTVMKGSVYGMMCID